MVSLRQEWPKPMAISPATIEVVFVARRPSTASGVGVLAFGFLSYCTVSVNCWLWASWLPDGVVAVVVTVSV